MIVSLGDTPYLSDVASHMKEVKVIVKVIVVCVKSSMYAWNLFHEEFFLIRSSDKNDTKSMWFQFTKCKSGAQVSYLRISLISMVPSLIGACWNRIQSLWPMAIDVNLYRPNSHECESNLLKYNFPDLGLQYIWDHRLWWQSLCSWLWSVLTLHVY